MMSPKSGILLKILLVSEDLSDEAAIHTELEKDGFDLLSKRVDREADMVSALDNESWDLVIVDALLIKLPTLRVLKILRNRRQEIPHLVLFGSLTTITSVEILEASGIHEYVTKSNMSTLGKAIQREMQQAGTRLQTRLKLEQGFVVLMSALGRALELRDNGTEGHTERVTELALKLARKMGITKERLIDLHRGSLLHDIGKIGIPDSILRKPGELTESEWLIMKTHPVLARDFLAPIEILAGAMLIPYCHHERWDGTGYPQGLKGEDIPFEARIFSICDVWDAITSDRPYRKAMDFSAARNSMAVNAAWFDPKILPVFFELLEGEQHDKAL